MSDAGSGQPLLSEVTGSFHYQELIESRLGQPIATDIFNADAERLSSSPGARLAAARNASGWTVDQVATQLKITRHQILAIEADDYDVLPAPAIVRGFVRAYAKLLKLDSAPLDLIVSITINQFIEAPNTFPPSMARAWLASLVFWAIACITNTLTLTTAMLTKVSVTS